MASYHAGLDWYDLYFLIVSLWLLGSSQIKVSVLQEGISGTWKVVQCQLQFTSNLSISFFWYYSLLLFADADKIPHSYKTFFFFFFFPTHTSRKGVKRKWWCEYIHFCDRSKCWWPCWLVCELSQFICYTSVMSRNIYYERHWFWNNL